jgi:hypothetical protein
LSSDFKPLCAAIAEQGFHSFRAFSIKKVDGNFLDFESCFDLDLFKVVACRNPTLGQSVRMKLTLPK